MSILNVLLAQDRLLVAVDTLAEDAITGHPSSGAKLLLIPQHNVVLATRGVAQFFLRIYELSLQASFRADFSIDQLAVEIGPTMDRLWPAYVDAADKAGLPRHKLRTEIVVGGWSTTHQRMIATAYAKHATETPTLIQPLIGGLASPGEPLRGLRDSFEPADVLKAGGLQATYLNEREGRQVSGGSMLVADMRQGEARITEWPFLQPGLVRDELVVAGEPVVG